MPKAAAELGAARAILPLAHIAAELEMRVAR
jgi:chemotaxis response regulator CheB